jgi:hypothetical protein
MADLSVSTMHDFELERPIDPSLVATIQVAIEAAGVTLVDETGEGPGVRLRTRKAEGNP